MKHLLPILFPVCLTLLCWRCGQNPAPAKVAVREMAVPVSNVQRITHAEAADSLRIDTTAAIKPLVYKKMSLAAMQALMSQNDIGSLVVNDSPDNGFYGDNHYRIEFILTEMTPRPDNPLIYQVKGKNRYKKTISTFAGLLEIKNLSEFTDPNLDGSELTDENLNVGKSYSVQGTFNFQEDSTLSSSGQFTGDFTMEFYTFGAVVSKKEASMQGPQLWFFSNNSPSQGSGYRFTGNWSGFKNPSVKKPVIWSRDIFRFANDVLDNFYYGERDVTINPKYRSLGWDTYWEGEEWWADSPKSAQ